MLTETNCDLCLRPDSGVTVDGAEPVRCMLVADNQGEPTLVSSGNLSFYVIFRESYALRIKDSQAPALLHFTGVKITTSSRTGSSRRALSRLKKARRLRSETCWGT